MLAKKQICGFLEARRVFCETCLGLLKNCRRSSTLKIVREFFSSISVPTFIDSKISGLIQDFSSITQSSEQPNRPKLDIRQIVQNAKIKRPILHKATWNYYQEIYRIIEINISFAQNKSYVNEKELSFLVYSFYSILQIN